MEPYEELANAIILQAVEDYRFSLKFLKKHPRTKELEDLVASQVAAREERRAERKKKKLPAEKVRYSREERLLEKIGEREWICEDVEKFFRSAWFQVLTTVDGEFLLRKLQEEVK